jgi:transcription elongation factor GreA
MTAGTFLTQSAYEKLVEELHHLEDVAVPDVVKRIDIARSEGDLKENGGYHAAREEHGKYDGRIKQLKSLLADAVVGAAPDFDGVAGPGTVVVLRREGRDADERFLVGSREGLGDDDIDVYSPESPIGSAVTGHKAGDQVSFTAPSGKTFVLNLLTVEAFSS